MTRDYLIRMAHECGLHLGGPPLEPGLERFARAAYEAGAAAERERIKAERPSPLCTNGCPVCGLGSDGNAVWYCCSRGDCPTRVTCTGAK